MVYECYSPRPPLDRFVERFWLISDAPKHARERILPAGTIELVVNLIENEIRIYDPAHGNRCRRFSGAVVSGTYSRCFVIDPLQHASMLGAHFRPGGAFPFLGTTARELADAHVDLENLWGSSAPVLREQLCCAGSTAERFSWLEAALVRRLGNGPAHHHATLTALDAFDRPGTCSRVRDIARLAGLSHRRFIQVFAAEVGVTPKLYSRLRRFHRVLELARRRPKPAWARLAGDCGYFDQSHLIRDFLEFSSMSPEQYVRRRSDRVMPDHVAQSGESEVNNFQYR